MLLQLYLHFPFCKRKCFYCDFCSFPKDESVMAAYCDALCEEIRTEAPRFRDAQISTVFLGGGTPTLVPARDMKKVLHTLRSSFTFVQDVEFTSEGNPGTLTSEWLQMVQGYGVNRLSLGAQASQDALLRQIGRIHNHAQTMEAVKLARQSGIRNLNLDVMFGLPSQTSQMYMDTLKRIVALAPEHISAYSLILEEGTLLEKQVNAKQVLLPDEEETEQMYMDGKVYLESNGYHRYEISNYAKPGFACKHNLGYWQDAWYLGLGLAAHSMLPPSTREKERGIEHIRRANTSTLEDYILHPEQDRETLTIGCDEACFESLMLSLRTLQGVNGKRFEEKHGISLRAYRGSKLDEMERQGLGRWTSEGYTLTERGLDVQNELLVRLMDASETNF